MSITANGPNDEVLPWSNEAERATLGVMLLGEQALRAVASRLEPKDFYQDAHQVIYGAILRLVEQDKAVDLTTLTAHLAATGELEDCGGADYLMGLSDNVSRASMAPDYADIVLKESCQRQGIRIADRIHEALKNDKLTPAERIDKALKLTEELESIRSRAQAPDQQCKCLTGTALVEILGGVKWLWQDWLPLGYITILAGEPGAGKSAIAQALAAVLTDGHNWPTGEGLPDREPSRVLICDSEGAQGIWSARLVGWNLSKEQFVFFGDDGCGRLELDSEADLGQVRAWLQETRAQLVIIDSLRAALPAKINENDSSVQTLLAPWASLCREEGCSLLIVHHFNKPQMDSRSLMNRLRGSSGIAAAARSIIAIDDPDPNAESGLKRLQVVKSNLGQLSEPLGFKVTKNGIEWSREAPRLQRQASALDDAEGFLREALKNIGQPSSVLIEQAAKKGISKNALYRAKEALRLVVTKDPADVSHKRKLWTLPTEREAPPEFSW